MSSAQTQVGVLTYMTQSTAATSVSFTANLKKDTTGNGFDSILTNLSNSQNNTPKAEVVSSKDVKNDTLDSSKKTENVSMSDKAAKTTTESPQDTKEVNTVEPEEEKVVNTNETDGKEANEELQNAISEDGKKLIKELAEMADVSEEEIIAVMQLIGITPADLLNPENVIQVVNELSESENGVDLIVDSELYESLKDVLTQVGDMRQDLITDYDIPEENLDQVIQNVKEMKAPEEDAKDPVFEEVLEKAPTIATDEKAVKVEIKQETQVPEREIKVQATESQITQVEDTHQETSNSSEHKESGSNLFKHEQSVNPFNQLVQNIVEATPTETNPIDSYTDRAQMENIIRQITEKITVSAGTEETSMELQLHPATLGHVNILLTSSKDGITAKFTAQNEIVKEAVESQMTALMQKFDEQGVKVTSVEVTIASHAFEQNLQQEDRGETAKDQMEKNKKSLRRINLNEIDEEIEEEMSQAELIAAQMMAYNGNTIDFSA
ncbi:MAG: flagellar hook-length control protein FliK [Butyrivibrio sp.]|nr:flagellar hook-length control protein FliK [Butyrivibrio sp.]